MTVNVTTFLLFFALLQVSAASLAQKVTLSATNAPISTIFNQIEKQTGYDFAFTSKILEKANPVTINVKNEDLKTVLDQIFQSQPLDYQIEDKFVTVSVKQPTIIDKIKSTLNLDKITVTGRIIDERGQPLSGATITVKGTGNSVNSDLYGNFVLKNVSPGATLVFTFIGYDKKELPAKESMDVVKLDIASNPLNEVKVMAYSRESQRLSVNNSTTIKGEDIAKQPVNNPLLALEGRVPGLFISPQSGVPGSAIVVRIQGQNSINEGNDPFFVVDGVPYPSQTLTTQGGSGGVLGINGNSTGSPLSYINPSDIESISVLSDADATAIYGSRAANGAIIITTKKGKAGPTQVTADLQQGWGRNTHFLDLLNTQQYLEMRHEAKKNDNTIIDPIYEPDINGIWDTTRYTDWQRKLIGGTAQYTNANLSISGGSANVQYLVSGTYNRQSDVFPGNFADQKGGLHFNLLTTSANQKFKMQLNGNYLYDDNLLPAFDYVGEALSLPPDAPALYKTDGGINWAPLPDGSSSWALEGLGTNPAVVLLRTYRRQTNNLVANATFSYEVMKGLELQLNTGYNDNRTNELSTVPSSSFDPWFVFNYGNQNYATYGNANTNSWIIEPKISYQRDIGKGKLGALLGGTINQLHNFSISELGQIYNNDALLADFAAATIKTVNPELQSNYKYDALFGQLNYNWEDKYIIDLNVRRDGSSRFGSSNEFHDFWSIGGGWIFSEENFMKNNLSFLSYGKIKANYGITGNDQIGDYQFLSNYISSIPQIPYQGVGGLITTNLPNPNLQWEETHKLMVGVDLGFFKDRVLLGANYSRNRSSNQLINFKLPWVTGFIGIVENLPATVQNTSWQFTVSSVNIIAKDFKWTTGFNLTLPQNRLLSYPGLDPRVQPYRIGQPIGQASVFHFLGVDPATGIYQFADSQGNPTSNPNSLTDASVRVNPFPKYYGGLANNIVYKQFSLDFLFQFANKTVFNPYLFGNGLPGYIGNQLVSVLSRWQKPSDYTNIQRFNSDGSLGTQYYDAEASDAAYANGAYIRLKNLSFSYSMPTNWLNKIHVQNGNIFIRGENLLIITKYTGIDPETGSALPPLKILTIGLHLTF